MSSPLDAVKELLAVDPWAKLDLGLSVPMSKRDVELLGLLNGSKSPLGSGRWQGRCSPSCQAIRRKTLRFLAEESLLNRPLYQEEGKREATLKPVETPKVPPEREGRYDPS